MALPGADSTVITGDGQDYCLSCAVVLYGARGVYCTGCGKAPRDGMAVVGRLHAGCSVAAALPARFIGHGDDWDLLYRRVLARGDDPVVCSLCDEVTWPGDQT